jgi:hypothetical protein
VSRKTKITLGIIAALVLILVLQKNLKFSSVPGMKPWKDQADEIVLKNKSAAEIRIVKKDGKWVIGDKAFISDEQTVSGLEKKMNEFTLTEKVTSKEFYERFDLTPEAAVRVTVKAKGKVLRDVLIGKRSTGEQSFVKFPDKPEVYLAGGNLNSEFNKTEDSLRSKVLISCPQEMIESVAVKGKFAIEKKTEQPADPKAAPAASSAPQTPAVKWVVKDKGTEADQAKVNELLGDITSARAASFPDESSVKYIIAGGVKAEVSVKGNGKDITLTIYGKEKPANKDDKNAKYLCKSSETSYYAFIDPWKAEKFINASLETKAKK